MNLFLLGVLINLPKTFDSFAHQILTFKSEKYGVQGNNLQLLRSHLSNCKQLINSNNQSKTYNEIIFAVPQGSVIEPILFPSYLNDLQHASKTLHPVIFADDTNLFLADRNINPLFSTVNVDNRKKQTVVRLPYLNE